MNLNWNTVLIILGIIAVYMAFNHFGKRREYMGDTFSAAEAARNLGRKTNKIRKIVNQFPGQSVSDYADLQRSTVLTSLDLVSEYLSNVANTNGAESVMVNDPTPDFVKPTDPTPANAVMLAQNVYDATAVLQADQAVGEAGMSNHFKMANTVADVILGNIKAIYPNVSA